MNIRLSASISLGLAVFFSTHVIAKSIAIYRWVDENNVVHFSQQQPQGENYSQLTSIDSYKTTKTQENTAKTAKSAVDEQIDRYEKAQAEIKAKNIEIAASNCKAAQLNVKMLNSYEQVMTTDTDGKNKLLTKAEKAAQLNLSKKHVELYCTNR